MNIDTEVQRVRHPSLYLEDGDIILAARAESANLVQTFCVHRALLAHYSEVFRDMFVVGAAPSTQDATPEVVLPSDDLASDIATFLGVIYNAPSFHRKLCDRYDSNVLASLEGLVRVSKKYLVRDMAEIAYEYVSRQWPKTLQEWDMRAEELKIGQTLEPAWAIEFATTHSLLDILPAAFYALATTATNHNWDDTPGPRHLGARWSLLSAANAIRFAKGRDALIKFYANLLDSAISPHAMCLTAARGTTQYGACSSAFRRMSEIGGLGQRPNLVFCGGAWDCLGALKVMIKEGNESLCAKCRSVAVSTYEKQRETLWRKMPEFFDLAPS